MLTIRRNLLGLALAFWAGAFVIPARAELPEWIWNANHGAKPADGEVRYFRKTFTIDGKVNKATLTASGDDYLEIFINGQRVSEHSGWETPVRVEVAKHLQSGQNVIAMRGTNVTGDAGAIAMIEISLKSREKRFVLTDATWMSATKEEPNWTSKSFLERDGNWTKALSRGKLGVQPWGDVFKLPPATPAESLTLLPGFKVELVRSAEPGEGSWVSMAIDPRGRLIISPQDGTNNLLRVTLSKEGKIRGIEKIDEPVGSAMGLLCDYNSLFVNGKGPAGTGIYQLRDTGHNDRYDSVKLFKHIDGATGEHGTHAVVQGKDNHLYVISGNFTKLPKDLAPTSPHKNYAEDQLLPRAQDGNGFGNQILPPGGFLLRTDPRGRKWELYAAGMRNTYDFAVNPDGEMIGFDSDMEWDWGTPWYRPIRIFHLVSGGDYGFREGTGKWPEYYPDSLPATVNVGIGSPTGMKFGTDSNFPSKYKKALYALDWAYGRIFAVHLTPSGASYTATFETLLRGKPLNLTDIEFGHDGAMYFITGGRGTQSGLYRVTYVGSKEQETPLSKEQLAMEKQAAEARALRHKLESFHGHRNREAVAFCWPYLDSEDRFIRYAARIAIESQPVSEWQDRALSETRTNAAINGLLALARRGGKETQNALLKALTKFPLDSLTEDQKLEKLRVIELSFIHQGRPDPEMAKMGIEKLDRQYPSKSERLNRELAELLIYLRAPDVVEKTLTLADAAPNQEEQLHYIFHLRTLTNGWTMDERAKYFEWYNVHHQGGDIEPTQWKGSVYTPWTKRDPDGDHSAGVLKWFSDADREYSDGSSFPKFLANFKKDALGTLTDDERKELEPIITERTNLAPALTGMKRAFVKEWTMEDLEPVLDQAGHGRSFAKGKDAFSEAQCVLCHRFGNKGGSVGPDLTAVSSRFSRRDILESIILPSKVVSDQYYNTIIETKDGDDVVGRVSDEDDKKVVVMTNPMTDTKTEVLKSNISKRDTSKLSPMPEGLVNTFTQDEILDLIAYLEAGGKKNMPAFKKEPVAATASKAETTK
ncbi:MAG TPA: heme-binding protein [Verrucomicrobiae bacterium]|jgi:putative heme-binding domain-containing protein|nr:heme-binding protein [Verrucomicrobiae bacterium]